MQKYLNYRLGSNITKIREREYNETKANFATIEKTDLQTTSQQLSRFQYDGIVSKKNEYNDVVEQICDDVIADYRKKLGNIGTIGADEACSSIRSGIRKTSGTLQDIHEGYTEKIKQGISNKVGELGIKVTHALRCQIEQTVDTKTQDHFSDFAKEMQSQKKSEDEITRNDVKEIGQNEAAFRGAPEPRTTTREDLEAMFK